MTTLRDIVQRGLRESGIISVGSEPDADVFDETFAHLQTLVKSLLGNELGDPLVTYDVGNSGVISSDTFTPADSTSNAFVPSNTRLIFNITSPTIFYLPPVPTDGARVHVIDNLNNFATYNVTIYGNGRRIDDSISVVLNTSGDSKQWFYRDDLGDWVRVTDLLPSNESPLPDEFDDLLITLLAIRINPRYGVETHQETQDILKRTRSQFRARYHQTTEMPSEDGLINLPSRRRRTGFNSFFRGL